MESREIYPEEQSPPGTFLFIGIYSGIIRVSSGYLALICLTGTKALAK